MYSTMMFSIANEVVWHLDYVSLYVIIDGVYKEEMIKIIYSGV